MFVTTRLWDTSLPSVNTERQYCSGVAETKNKKNKKNDFRFCDASDFVLRLENPAKTRKSGKDKLFLNRNTPDWNGNIGNIK